MTNLRDQLEASINTISGDEDYPLQLLIAVKQKLFAVCEDPTLEDARAILDALVAWADTIR